MQRDENEKEIITWIEAGSQIYFRAFSRFCWTIVGAIVDVCTTKVVAFDLVPVHHCLLLVNIFTQNRWARFR